MTKRTTAADQLGTAVYVPTKRNWLDKLKPEHRADLLEIKRRYVAGEYPHPMTFIYEWVGKNVCEIPVAYNEFRRWLRGTRL